MKRLIEYFVDRSFVVNLIAIFICAAGLLAAFTLSRDLIPAFEFKYIRINTVLPGASAVEMERNVTFPIEEGLETIPGLKEISSSSSSSRSDITLEFKSEHDDMLDALERTRALVEGVRNTLPDGIEEINVAQIRIDSIRFMSVTVENVNELDNHDRDWVEAVQEAIRKVPGIVTVDSSMKTRNLYIEFIPSKLEEYSLSISEARGKILQYLTFVPVANLTQDENTYNIELSKELASVDEIANLPLKGNKSGNFVLLKDIANVEYRPPESDRLHFIDGHEYVDLDLSKDLTSDAVTLRDKVQVILDDFNTKVPKPITMRINGDGPHFIEQQLEVLRNNGLTGAIIVVIVLTIFIGWRTSLVTSLGIPVAYLGTFIVFQYLGITINLISVVGMIIIIGILVDDAIIVADRYTENIHSGLAPREAAVEASYSLIVPVTGTIITTIVAFSPILFVSGKFSSILFSIPVVIITALGLSWIECFFILPNHLQHFAKKVPKVDTNWFLWIKNKYKRALALCLKLRYVALVILIGFSVLSGYIAMNKLDKKFRLKIGSERLSIIAVLKQSDSLEQTAKRLEPIEDFLKALPKENVSFISKRIGRVWFDGHRRSGYRYGMVRLNIPLEEKNPRKVHKQLEKKIKPFLEEQMKSGDFEELKIRIMRHGGDEDKDDMVTIYVSGGDKLSFSEIQSEIQASVKNVKGVESVYLDEDLLEESWRFKIDQRQLETYRISTGELSSQIRQVFAPQKLGETRLRGDQLTVYTQALRRDEIKKFKYSDLENLQIISTAGLAVPIKFLGKWEKHSALKKIEHKNLLRVFKVDVKYDKEKSKADDLKDNVSVALEPLRVKHPAYEITVEEADSDEKEGKEWAMKVTFACMSLIVLVLALVLGTVSQPILVGLAIPFGIIGIIWALFIHDMPIGIMAAIGLVGTAGVAVNDSLIMVHTINYRMKKAGAFTRKLLIEGASSRLRAIILTTITTLGGVMPMAYGLGGESGFTQPLAFAMGWGLAFATLLTLFILPSLLEVREDFLTMFRWIGKKLSRKSA